MRKFFGFFIVTVLSILAMASCKKTAANSIVGEWVVVADGGYQPHQKDDEQLKYMYWYSFASNGSHQEYTNDEIKDPDKYAYYENGYIHLDGGKNNLKAYESSYCIDGSFTFVDDVLYISCKYDNGYGGMTYSHERYCILNFEKDEITMVEEEYKDDNDPDDNIILKRVKGYKSR